MMKSFEYEAVTYDASVYCVECLPAGVRVDSDECHPVFADSEWDYYPTCDKCGHRHEYVSLTGEGAVYEAEAAGAEIFHEDFANVEAGTWQAQYVEEAGGKDGLAGWYVWSCQPGCLPDGDPSGPFKSAAEAAFDYLG